MWTDPVLLLWMLLLACGAMRWRKWKKAAFITGSLAIFWLLLFPTPFVARFLINSLESQYRPFDTAQYAYLQDDSVYIVVLASGYTADAAFPPSTQLKHFRNAGLNPIPAPMDYHAKQDAYHDKVSIMPDAYNPVLMRFALHEYVGYIWGKIRWNSAKQSNL